MEYSEKAFNIVKESINSVVFIDDKAKDFYSTEPNLGNIEEKLSCDLFNEFKAEGISLTVYKFRINDYMNENIEKYLLKNRDLVLLDWELDGVGGLKYSLNLLSKVVDNPHINFCCIYTASSNFNDIDNNIKSYFSGLSKNDFLNIRNKYNYLDDEFKKEAIGVLNNNESPKISMILRDNSINSGDFTALGILSEKEILECVIFSLDNSEKSLKKECRVTSFADSLDSFIINNTFIFILKKENDDVKPSALIKRISNKLIDNSNSFIHLLGLEMQTTFNKNACFINEDLLKSSTEAIFINRNHMKDINGDDKSFVSLIKRTMVEHAFLRFRDLNIKMLSSDFLDTESDKYDNEPTGIQMASLNTFYNTVCLRNLKDKGTQYVNFGDIFVDKDRNYYLCITALCDCLRPSKIKNNYFFVIGREIKIDKANDLSDSGFISYIPNNKAINWVNIESIRKTGVKPLPYSKENIRERIEKDLSECNTPDEKAKSLANRYSECLEKKEKQIANLQNKYDSLESFRYKPVYIQPYIYNVLKPEIANNSIQISRIESHKYENDGNDNRDIIIIDATYVTTLRFSYVQRIANHAFSHPIRVGVDFVK